MKKWKLNILHLSHTDIGYTDSQARILSNHVNYIRDIVDNYKTDKKQYKNWKWICESFFAVEQFLAVATDAQKKIFNEMIDKEIISLSASYLNINELANANLYGSTLDKIKRIAKENKWKINSAITNDINGFSLGYAMEMQKHGVENLFFGLHTHHGMFPCFKKQNPFKWKMPNGKVITVFVSEHYQIGNELGLINTAFSNYILQSSFEEGYFTEDKQIKEGAKRIRAYVKQLEKDGYKHTNVPISTLGESIDNAPSNINIPKRIEALNKELKKDGIELEMETLEGFFKNLKAEKKPIDTFEGDWPDWWSDGNASTPQDTRIFKQAQRNYEYICKMKIESPEKERLEQLLMMYAEHTFAAWSSMENPFEFWTQEISSIKASYAATALALSSGIIDRHVERKVHKLENANTIKLKFATPLKNDIKHCLHLNPYLSSKENRKFAGGFEALQGAKKVKTFTVMQYYMNIPQPQYYAIVDLSKSSEITLKVKEQDVVHMTSRTSTMASDKISDVYNPLNNDEVVVTNKTIENDFLKMQWNEDGIYSLFSKVAKKELLTTEQEGLFTPIYEISEIPYEFEQMNLKRRWTGRNRRMSNAQRFAGKIKEVKIYSDTKDFTSLDIFYEVKGTKFYRLNLKIANDTNTIDATINMIKDIEWSLENFYISLPFNKPKSQILFDKGGMFEIWKEQLPGTTIDYYSIQEGIEIKENNKTTALISTMDSNLFWTGSLEYQRRFLAHDNRNKETPSLYAWVMNNAWETNFNADISGFHEFRYKITLPKTNKDTLNNLKTLNSMYTVTRR